MIWSILLQAVVSLLVYFFEKWWSGAHPTPPNEEARLAFIGTVHGSWKLMVFGKSLREKAANYAFDQFAANYKANPPVVELSDAPLSESEARGFAAIYAKGIV